MRWNLHCLGNKMVIWSQVWVLTHLFDGEKWEELQCEEVLHLLGSGGDELVSLPVFIETRCHPPLPVWQLRADGSVWSHVAGDLLHDLPILSQADLWLGFWSGAWSLIRGLDFDPEFGLWSRIWSLIQDLVFDPGLWSLLWTRPTIHGGTMEKIHHYHQPEDVTAVLYFLSPAKHQWWDHEDHLMGTTGDTGLPGRWTSGWAILREIQSDGKAEAQPSAHLCWLQSLGWRVSKASQGFSRHNFVLQLEYYRRLIPVTKISKSCPV